jgi:methionyl-tRNA formyltransferase
VHPSLLPRWRGPDPYFHAIAAGDAITGVTLHRLDAGYDTGAIVARREVPIRDRDDSWSLARRLDRPSLALLLECAAALARGDELRGQAQDGSLATEAPAPTEEDLALRFADCDAASLARLVRAGAPEPGAKVVLGETLVSVLRAREWSGAFPGGLLPGEAFVAPDATVVRAKRGGLAIERVRIEDGDEIAEGAAIAALVSGGSR